MNRVELIKRIKERFNLDRILFLDFETYYKTRANNGEKSFSLGNKTYAQYILGEMVEVVDPETKEVTQVFSDRFQTTGFGYAYDLDDWTYIHTPADIQQAMDAVHAERAAGKRIGVVAHNTQFDASIMCWRYGVNFDHYFCTQLMAKCRNVCQSSSLKNQAIILFPDDETMRKGKELANYDGVRYEDIPLEHQDPSNSDTLASYCVQDNHLMREIFIVQMGRGFPEGEIELMHLTLRAAVEPQFVINRQELFDVIDRDEQVKQDGIVDAIQFCFDRGIHHVGPDTFSSNPKFKELLEQLGVNVPLKMSKTTFKMTPALGKNDPEYIKMQIAHPELTEIYLARERVKSTINISRAKRMIDVADLFDAESLCDTVADMPFFLNYYGAENTGRWSGGQKLNQQNLTADRAGDKSEGHHRRSMMAIDGYQIGVCDLSNIELRVNLWVCGQQDILDQIEQNESYDYYCDLASGTFGRAITKADKKERQIGKAQGLGLGFAMGWYGFQQYLASGPLGMEPTFISDSEAKSYKNAYDARHYAVREMWEFIQRHVLPTLAGIGSEDELAFGPNCCLIARRDQLVLPSGRILHYPNTEGAITETEYGPRFSYTCDGSRRDRFGKPLRRGLHRGLIIENIAQSLARDILGWQMVRIERRLAAENWGWLIGSVHDETLNMLKNETIEQSFAYIQEQMSVGPEWAAGLPLDCEGGYAPEYSK